MAEQIYKDLMEKFAKRGGRYPGLDIPEFYDLARELFTPEEATVASVMPKGFSTAEQVAEILGRGKEEVESTLQTMTTKGLLLGVSLGGPEVYRLPAFVPGIFEYQFMRGTRTEKDFRLARLINNYRKAVDAINGMPRISFPPTRVIPINEKIESGSKVHTYDQLSAYVESADPISVCTCFCRHEAELIDPNDTCGSPNDVCMSFNIGARFAIDKGMGREVSKKEALEILRQSEEAGLVHCSVNRQDLEFVCNCCPDHCVILEVALAQPKPGLALNSGFQPRFDAEECNACEDCIDRCPATALAMSQDSVPLVDLDRCFGCGICATSCPAEAVALIAKDGFPEPPADLAALKQAFRTAGVS